MQIVHIPLMIYNFLGRVPFFSQCLQSTARAVPRKFSLGGVKLACADKNGRGR